MPITVSQFLRNIERSGLMSLDEAKALCASFLPEGQDRDAAVVARELVRRNLLTRFQAASLCVEKPKRLAIDKYVLLDKLGQGGMGSVFKALDRDLGRIVALKVLSKGLLKSNLAVDRFRREIKASALLNHPNIVTTFDAGEFNGVWYLVMQHLEGATLSAIVRRNGPLPIRRAVDFTLQAARGLRYAHDRGICHRDIKPSNLMLDTEGYIRILDFGLARVADLAKQPVAATVGEDLTGTGTILGTPDYMAPEQAISARSADGRVDIYSLGCTLHYLLTASPPFTAESLMEKVLAHRDAPIPSLRTRRSESPAALDAVFAKTMQKDPDDRYQTVGELIADLEQFLGENSASSDDASPAVGLLAVAPVGGGDTEPSFDRQATTMAAPSRDLGLTEAAEAAARRNRKRSAFRWMLAVAGAGVLAVAAAWSLGGWEPPAIPFLRAPETAPTGESNGPDESNGVSRSLVNDAAGPQGESANLGETQKQAEAAPDEDRTEEEVRQQLLASVSDASLSLHATGPDWISLIDGELREHVRKGLRAAGLEENENSRAKLAVAIRITEESPADAAFDPDATTIRLTCAMELTAADEDGRAVALWSDRFQDESPLSRYSDEATLRFALPRSVVAGLERLFRNLAEARRGS